MINPHTLRGVWALVPTPWTPQGEFDEAVFRQDVAYLSRSGVHGLYTTGSSGEFYALEFEEFRRLVDAFLEEVGPAGLAHQIGCGWTDSRGALQRASYAVERGARAIQVVFPYYGPLSLEEAIRFMEELARVCGPVPLIHYNTPHARLVLEAEDYRRLIERVPTLIGTKLSRGEPLWFATFCERVPELSHFGGEYTFVADMMGGARGLYSWLAVTNPGLALTWYEACVKQDWKLAIDLQCKVNRYKIHVKSSWKGQTDAALNKADASLNPHIRCGLSVRPPYAACTAGDLKAAAAWCRRHFPELLELNPAASMELSPAPAATRTLSSEG